MFKIHASLLHDNEQRFAYEAGWLARLVGKLKLLKLVLLFFTVNHDVSCDMREINIFNCL